MISSALPAGTNNVARSHAESRRRVSDLQQAQRRNERLERENEGWQERNRKLSEKNIQLERSVSDLTLKIRDLEREGVERERAMSATARASARQLSASEEALSVARQQAQAAASHAAELADQLREARSGLRHVCAERTAAFESRITDVARLARQGAPDVPPAAVAPPHSPSGPLAVAPAHHSPVKALAAAASDATGCPSVAGAASDATACPSGTNGAVDLSEDGPEPSALPHHPGRSRRNSRYLESGSSMVSSRRSSRPCSSPRHSLGRISSMPMWSTGDPVPATTHALSLAYVTSAPDGTEAEHTNWRPTTPLELDGEAACAELGAGTMGEL